MAKVEIYGASDDLIEIEGGISEEFNPRDDENNYLGFSDGTILKIRYDNDGVWRIVPLIIADQTVYDLVQATDPDEGYSDHAWLTGDIEWVIFGNAYGSKVI